MKTLILAENSDFSHDLEKIILKNNCSPIIYHSALKALDNIEEIAPEILIVHTGDFPRHWKTLIQYTQTLFPQRQVAIYLFVSDYFSQKDITVLDFFAGRDVPIRHAVGDHRLLVLRLETLALAHVLHDLERNAAFEVVLLDQNQHDAVARSDYLGNIADAFLN